jgi:hypothetical protein
MKISRNSILGMILILLLFLVGSATAVAQGTFSKPGLITSVGQSSDIAVIKALLNTKLKLGLEVNPIAKASDLTGVKTLIVVLGSSTKGLGSAGINMDQETERTKDLLKAAKERGIRVLALHTGGESRRGKGSNDLIEVVVPESQQVVVVETGNKDKFFNNLAAKRGIPVTEVPNLAAAGDVIKGLFKD